MFACLALILVERDIVYASVVASKYTQFLNCFVIRAVENAIQEPKKTLHK